MLLKDVSFTVNPGERVGLVGWNGAGKTTVLRIIRGEMEADAGDVRMTKNAKVASLNQEVRTWQSCTHLNTRDYVFGARHPSSCFESHASCEKTKTETRVILHFLSVSIHLHIYLLRLRFTPLFLK